MDHPQRSETPLFEVDRSADTGDSTLAVPNSAGMPTLERGELVDRYVVVGQVGAGGMAVVYAAYDPELDRKVAIKVLRDLPDSGTLDPSEPSAAKRGRALREAQALAKLSHPNVLPIYDVGTVKDRIFLATEFVDGSNLKEWLKEDGRTWRDVLPVFLEAGRGLAAAHAEGLVHRDFKPANVMISRAGGVRVMDFGLVRRDEGSGQQDAPKPDDDDNTMQDHSALDHELTSMGMVMGTPAYMAPEQHLGATVDARADQYSFCVALFEGLCGARPFRQRGVSLVAAKGTLNLSPLKGNERKVPRWIRRIVLRGLSPRPEDRWPSMAALLAALSRPPLRRSPKVWAAATFVAAVGVGGLFAQSQARSAAQMCRGGAERVDAIWNPERQAAIQDVFAATSVPDADAAWSKARTLLDDYASQWARAHQDACEATQVRHEQSTALMDLRMACLQHRFWEFEALLDVFEDGGAKTVQRSLSAASSLRSLEHCEDLAALQADVPPPDSPEVRAQVDRLEKARAGVKALADTGRVQDAIATLEPLATEAESIEYPPIRARLLGQLGHLQLATADHATAEKTLSKAAWLATSHRMFDVAAEAQANLVYVVGYGLARPDEALQWANHAEAILAAAGGRKDLAGHIQMNRGIAWYRKGDMEKSFELMVEGTRLRGEYYGEDHPQLITSLSNLSVLARNLDRPDEALTYVRRAVEIGEKHLLPESQDLALPLQNLGINLAEAGDYEAAEPYHRRALRIWKRSTGARSPQTAQALEALGDLRRLQGRHDEAAEFAEQVLAIREETEGREHPEFAQALKQLGLIREQQGRLDDALAQYDRAILVYAKAAAGSHGHVSALTGRSRVLLALNRTDEALVSAEQAMAIVEANNPKAEFRAGAKFALAKALTAAGQERKRARDLARQAADAWKAGNSPLDRKRSDEVTAWIEEHLDADPG